MSQFAISFAIIITAVSGLPLPEHNGSTNQMLNQSVDVTALAAGLVRTTRQAYEGNERIIEDVVMFNAEDNLFGQPNHDVEMLFMPETEPVEEAEAMETSSSIFVTAGPNNPGAIVERATASRTTTPVNWGDWVYEFPEEDYHFNQTADVPPDRPHEQPEHDFLSADRGASSDWDGRQRHRTRQPERRCFGENSRQEDPWGENTNNLTWSTTLGAGLGFALAAVAAHGARQPEPDMPLDTPAPEPGTETFRESVPEEGTATAAHRYEENGELDWTGRSSAILRLVRGLPQPSPSLPPRPSTELPREPAHTPHHSMLEVYDPDDMELFDSPPLRAMQVNLTPSPSPPPAVPLPRISPLLLVDPKSWQESTKGDAILLSFLDDMNNRDEKDLARREQLERTRRVNNLANAVVPSLEDLPELDLDGGDAAEEINPRKRLRDDGPTVSWNDRGDEDRCKRARLTAITSPDQHPSQNIHDPETYSCTYKGCTLRFGMPAKLWRHNRECHRMQPPQISSSHATFLAAPHKCERINPGTGKPCNTIVSRPYDLTLHELTIHNIGKYKVRCLYCTDEKVFSRRDALVRHMRVLHPSLSNFPPLLNPYRPTTTVTPDVNLSGDQHLQSLIRPSEHNFQSQHWSGLSDSRQAPPTLAPQPQQQSGLSDWLAYYNNLGTTSLHRVEESNKSNTRGQPPSIDTSVQHERSKAGELQCSYCTNRYSRECEKTSKHEREVHEKRFTCPEGTCAMIFGTKRDAQRHHEAKHTCAEEKSGKGFICTFEGCGKSFTRHDNWLRHVQRVHVKL